MVAKETIFTRKDFNKFRHWVNIDVDSVTWSGEKLDDFEKFWFSFFLDGLSLGQLSSQFEYVIFKSKSGPLASWFRWIFEKFICFSFINKEITIYRLSKETKLSLPQVAVILRNFFVDFYPHLGGALSDMFQMNNIVDGNINRKYRSIKKQLAIKDQEFGTKKGDLMASIEAVVYPEWKMYFSGPKNNLFSSQTSIQRIKAKASLKQQIFFVRDLIILFTVAFIVFRFIEQTNKVYEKYLLDRIQRSGHQFDWSNEALSFQRDGKNDISDIPLSVEYLKEQQEYGRNIASTEEERFETESEVSLTSVENLPKNIDAAAQIDQNKKDAPGYRDSRYGTTKVYRVMMRSTDIILSKKKLDEMMRNYSTSRVEGGYENTYVPGGLYYNIFIPREYTGEFLAQVMEIDQAVLYESRTRNVRNERGKDKIFIWVKSLN